MKAQAIVVPFKGEGYKSRLSSVLGPSDRRELALLLLGETLQAVGKAGMRARCHVVSSDPSAEAITRKAGCSFIHEARAAGVNSAVKLAMRKLGDRDRFMVIPSDLPLVSPSDLLGADELGRLKQVVISPSTSFNGTNLLLFSRSPAFRLSYDSDSFWNHVAEAARLRLATVVLTARGLLFDLDTPADAEELVSLGINTRPARFLRKSLGK